MYRRYRILITQRLFGDRESERVEVERGSGEKQREMEKGRETEREEERERERGRKRGRGEGGERERERTTTVRLGEKITPQTATEDLSLNKQFYMQFPQTYFHLL